MAAAPGIRIGDADREALAGELREHYAHGRLTLEEFQQRLDSTFTARTDLDLRRITADLPHQPARPAAAPTWTPVRAPADQSQRGQQSGWGQRRSGFGAFATVAWLLLAVLLVTSLIGHGGGHAARPFIILLAVLAFSRGILRRLLCRGRSVGSRRGRARRCRW